MFNIISVYTSIVCYSAETTERLKMQLYITKHRWFIQNTALQGPRSRGTGGARAPPQYWVTNGAPSSPPPPPPISKLFRGPCVTLSFNLLTHYIRMSNFLRLIWGFRTPIFVKWSLISFYDWVHAFYGDSKYSNVYCFLKICTSVTLCIHIRSSHQAMLNEHFGVLS